MNKSTYRDPAAVGHNPFQVLVDHVRSPILFHCANKIVDSIFSRKMSVTLPRLLPRHQIALFSFSKFDKLIFDRRVRKIKACFTIITFSEGFQHRVDNTFLHPSCRSPYFILSWCFHPLNVIIKKIVKQRNVCMLHIILNIQQH